ncbi:hypothetical protein GYMLUDRAFT_41301 [Collybiopsis luxurians FD-317 M1]|uniref:NADH dehydrogenase [ubiquinone] 1 beta subcomplex subunit 8, mitochondrial n=1 Tax=Collybiopsis luxurians FD-317 M1 TaxID=944289 RepID=A0A0D0CJP1_9AGAR|nr:hypothetical protein GYMLUDRAFT_41301 [Collybiopsis luxurians FD-317 M1]
MSAIVQRVVQRAVRHSFPRFASTIVATKSGHIPIDIDTNPEPLPNYQYGPPISRQYLHPYGWDDLQMRRNFGDPLPEHDEHLSMWGPDIPPPGVNPRTALTHFILGVAGFTSVFFGVKWFLTPEPHFVRRTYPHEGLVAELGGLADNKARIQEEGEE